MRSWSVWVLAVCLAGCDADGMARREDGGPGDSSDAAEPVDAAADGDGGGADAGSSDDAGGGPVGDAGTVDAGTMPSEGDAGPLDGGAASDAGLTPTLPPTYAQVRTFAGSGARGSVDGAASVATFSEPTGLAFTATGDLLVVDRGSGRIRSVSPAGDVRTLSLAGESLRGPHGIAVGGDGAVYVSDADDHCIRRIDGGTVRVWSGVCGTRGFADGDRTSARFDRPRQLALDGMGRLWVADGTQGLVRRIAADGSVVTVAGTPDALTSTLFLDAPLPGALYFPWGVGVAADGTVLVGGQDACVRRVAGGRVERLAGQCGNFGNTGLVDGAGPTARFAWVRALLVAPWGTLLVADAANHAVRTVAADGTVATLTGGAAEFADGPLAVARFREPSGLALDAAGRLYVADSQNQRIRRID